MNDDKEKPLNINAHRRQNTLKRKSSRLNKSQAKKKETKFINTSIIIFLIFIILIILLGYLIYKKFNEIEEIKLSIIEKNKEIENNIKNKDNLKARIKDLNKVLNNKEHRGIDDVNIRIIKENKLKTITKRELGVYADEKLVARLEEILGVGSVVVR